jgi:hypothetical protein
MLDQLAQMRLAGRPGKPWRVLSGDEPQDRKQGGRGSRTGGAVQAVEVRAKTEGIV